MAKQRQSVQKRIREQKKRDREQKKREKAAAKAERRRASEEKMTEEEYEKTLTRIEELMDAKTDTPEGDELDLLAKRVEEYESEHYPMGDDSGQSAPGAIQ